VRRYSDERKAAVLSRLLPPNNQSVPEVVEAEGISSATLYNWLKQAREQGVPVPGSRASNAEQWSGEAKFAAVVETLAMNEAEKSAYCREKGLYPEQIERWRQACIGGVGAQSSDSEPLRQARNEIKRLKRKVERKDKALAESAALLVLSKKFQALWEDEEQ
jgi:transposase